MKKNRIKKIPSEALYIIVQTVVISFIASLYVAWGCTKLNSTFIQFLNGIKESGINNKIFFDLLSFNFIILVILIGFINFGIYIIISSIMKNKKKK